MVWESSEAFIGNVSPIGASEATIDVGDDVKVEFEEERV